MSTSFQTFLHDTTFDDVPTKMLDLARYWMLDLIGVAIAGRPTELADLICDHAVEQFGGGPGKLLFDGRHASPAGIALAGGMTIDALDGHDGHKLTKGHTGCGVFPSLVSFAQATGLQCEKEFLTTFVIGYEIATRAGVSLHNSVSDYHTSGAWVSIGIAAMGARLLGLDENRTRQAIGIAEYHGPRSQMMRTIDHPTMVKDGSGWGAMAGVSAAFLARDGFTGAPALTVEAPDLASIWSDLGSRWYISEQYFKYFPVCRWAQPPLQAVLNLRSKHGLTSSDVERIEISTFHESRRLAVTRPKTTEEAQYSTAYPSAVAMVRGTCGPQDVEARSFSDPEIVRLAETITITEKDEYNAAFPQRRIADVTLVLRSGTKLNSGPVEALGDPEMPPPYCDIRKKYLSYAAPLIGETRTHEIEKLVLKLGETSKISDLTDHITAPI